MRPLAAVLVCAAAACAQDADYVTKTYDVRALVKAEQDRPGPRIELRNLDPRPVESGEEFFPGFDPDGLSTLLQGIVGPDAWANEGVSLELEGGWMTVRQTAAVQARIASVLSVLARAASRRAAIDAQVVLLAPGTLEELGAEAGVITEAQDRGIREAAAGGKSGKTLSLLRTSAIPGMLGHVADVRERMLVTDYEIEIAIGSAVADPVSTLVYDGTTLELRPTFAPDGATVLVDYRFACARPGTVREFGGKVKPEGTIQLPARAVFSTAGTWPCATGRTTLLVPGGAAATEEGWTLAVLLQVRRVEEPMGDIAFAGEGTRLRLLETGALTAPVTDVPKRRLDLSEIDPQEGVTIPVEDSGSSRLELEQVEGFVKRQTGYETWGAEGFGILTTSNRLMVTATEPVLDATETALKELSRTSFRRAAVDAVVVAVSAADRGRLPASDLLALARKGGSARVLARASALGLTAQRVTAFAGAESAFVRDRTVQIAENSAATDPQIDILTEGLALNARPFEPDAAGRSRVELEAQFGWRAALEATATGAAPGGVLERSSIDLLEARATIGLKAGEWSVAAEAVREGDAKSAECLVLLVRVRFPEVR